MPESPVLEMARRYQAQLAGAELRASRRLIDNHLNSWRRLEAMLDKLLLEIGDNAPTRGQLVRMERYTALMRQVANELAGLQSQTGNEIEAAGSLVKLGEASTRQLMALTIGETKLATMFNVLPSESIKTLLGFLDPTGPLFDRLRNLTGVNAQYVADAITQGITLGYSPIKTAGLVQDAFGRGLTDALRMVRTAQLWAYREANRASMIANQDVLQGWVWNAHFDDRTCMSCIAMHGTVHPVEEPLNDHHNGRAEIQGNLILADDTTALETRRYNGEIIVINTASGKFLAVTPNHPVLTRRGWIAAARVQKGDYVISDSRHDWASGGGRPDKHNIPTRIEEIPRSINMLRLGRVPETAKHLNGYGADGEVDIIFIDRLLWNWLNPTIKQKIKEDYFGIRHFPLLLPGIGGLDKGFRFLLSTSRGFLGGQHHRLSISLAHSNVSERIGFGHSSSGYTTFEQNTSDYISRNAQRLGYDILRFASNIPTTNLRIKQSDLVPGVLGNFPALDRRSFGGSPKEPMSLEMVREGLLGGMPTMGTYFRAITSEVVFDRVVEIGIRNLSGHVYSLQTQKEWYYSNGIISHNCVAIPLVNGFDSPIEQTGVEWFSQQSQAQQRAMMGNAKYQAWQDGKIGLEQLTTERTDEVYGPMRGEPSLKSLIGAAV